MHTLQYERHFTPEEATAMLPLIRKIVEDIQSHGHALQELKKMNISATEHTQKVDRHIKTVNSFFAELEELGCYYKAVDFEIGMIDFPGIIDDEEVFLCWKSDEEKITWYHPLNAGFKGRREIPESLLNSAGS